ncbi:MAG: hypothetical protein NC936_05775 [Candidatus Omnitrophica bacterium]|nr:hypothetical protein [Candidatus Omnitrophota bacterium]MCM8771350.1 hypothetical protein [Candidatus Omnitrophota bacterium]
MKRVFIILIIIVSILFGLYIFKDKVLCTVVSTVGTQVTGARIEIKGFSLGILRQTIRIKDLKMYNPRGFSGTVLLDIPKVVVNYDLPSLLKGRLHLKLVDVELKELGLEKSKDGKLNVDSLKVAKGKKAAEKKPSKKVPLQIDELNLKIGRIVSRDYNVEKPPLIEVYDINLNKSYKNITSAEQLVALILVSSLQAAGIKGAAIYGAATLAGVAALPVGLGVVLLGKDYAQQDFRVSWDKLFKVSKDILMKRGKVSREDINAGLIDAEVDGASVTVRLKAISGHLTQITISARKYLLPKPEIASGILYQITERLK